MQKKVFIGLALLLCAGLSVAQEIGIRLSLRDESVVSGTSKMNNILLVTEYGKLDIPIKNITSLELGITPDTGKKDKVENLVKQLGNSNEEMRKNAYNELTKLDINTIPVLSSYIYSEKYEPSANTDYTAENALTELLTLYGISQGYSEKDIVTIDNQYTIGGTYDFKSIELKTEYGNLSVPKSKIKSIEILYTPGTNSNAENNFKLIGSKHISGNINGGWLKTGIMLKSGQPFSINASGEVSLASLSGNKYKPDGSVIYSTGASYDDGGYNNTSAYPTYGNVVYKIGDSGAMQKAGAKFSGTANANGILYISIYETVYNTANTGSYNVKVSLK